jgi:hypothetical protein
VCPSKSCVCVREKGRGSCLESCAGQRATLGRPWNVSSQLFSRGAISQAYPLLEPSFSVAAVERAAECLMSADKRWSSPVETLFFSFRPIVYSYDDYTNTILPSYHRHCANQSRRYFYLSFFLIAIESFAHHLVLPRHRQTVFKKRLSTVLWLCAGPIKLACVCRVVMIICASIEIIPPVELQQLL